MVSALQTSDYGLDPLSSTWIYLQCVKFIRVRTKTFFCVPQNILILIFDYHFIVILILNTSYMVVFVLSSINNVYSTLWNGISLRRSVSAPKSSFRTSNDIFPL